MTRITHTPAEKDEYGFARLAVNGRYLGIPARITSIEKVGAGKWKGQACGEQFEIIGGKASGGGANDWFLKFELGYGDQFVSFNSAKQCIMAIENV